MFAYGRCPLAGVSVSGGSTVIQWFEASVVEKNGVVVH